MPLNSLQHNSEPSHTHSTQTSPHHHAKTPKLYTLKPLTKPNYRLEEPKYIFRAKKFQEWCDTMQQELDALHQTKTWSLVPGHALKALLLVGRLTPLGVDWLVGRPRLIVTLASWVGSWLDMVVIWVGSPDFGSWYSSLSRLMPHLFSLILRHLNLNTCLNIKICIKSYVSRSEYTFEN